VVLANLNTGTLWTQGAFHPGSVTGLGDYNAVLANFNATAGGGLAEGHAGVVYRALRGISPSVGKPAPLLTPAVNSASPGLASDLTLEVNTNTGDVYILANNATALTGYDIFDKSNNLLTSGDPNTDMNELLLAQPTTSARGNTTTFRNATNYKLWTTILDNGSTLAEGQNNGKLKQGTASTYDTINVPANGTIDFGDIYNKSVNKQDLTFSFSEADPTNGGNPVTGTTYNGGLDYYAGYIPEPGMLGLMGPAGIAMMRRRRRLENRGRAEQTPDAGFVGF
jgi:hypothetical protein